MSAFRAYAAVALGEVRAAGEMYDALRPHSGTFIGFDSGATTFGPMDNLLADLAEVRGDAETAAALRADAETLVIDVRRSLDSLAPLLDSIDDMCGGSTSDKSERLR